MDPKHTRKMAVAGILHVLQIKCCCWNYRFQIECLETKCQELGVPLHSAISEYMEYVIMFLKGLSAEPVKWYHRACGQAEKSVREEEEDKD